MQRQTKKFWSRTANDFLQVLDLFSRRNACGCSFLFGLGGVGTRVWTNILVFLWNPFQGTRQAKLLKDRIDRLKLPLPNSALLHVHEKHTS